MNVLNRSSSSALVLQYDDTMETRCSERGLHTLADAEILKHFESTTLTTGEKHRIWYTTETAEWHDQEPSATCTVHIPLTARAVMVLVRALAVTRVETVGGEQ